VSTSDKPALNFHILPNSLYIIIKLGAVYRQKQYLHFYFFLSQIIGGPGFVNYKKGCTRLAAASDKAYQLLAHGRWFSPGSPASTTTKTGRHDIAEMLLKVALKHQNNDLTH
jgi:hypothetical protein